MSTPRALKVAFVLALAVTACDDPARVAAPEAPAASQHGDAGLVVTTWPQSVIAEFETELVASLATRDPVVSIEWRFADGSLARGSKVRHTFAREGVTSVLVRATTEDRGVVQRQLTITVSPGISALATQLSGIVAGGVHACAIDAATSLRCWGFNGNGNLGDGSAVISSAVPVMVGGGVSFAQVASGFSHSCALTTAGVAYCWGRNYSGQLGDGTTLDRLTPTLVATNLTFKSIDVGLTHSCAVTDAGAAYCWGANGSGQLGTGGLVSEALTPAAVATTVTFNYVRAGYSHTCGLDAAGNAYCWGANNRGQMGNGTGGLSESDKVVVPTLVVAPGAFVALDAGGAHTCGIIVDRVYCWGWDGAGQLGSNGSPSCVGGYPCQKSPTRISGSRRYSAVTAGSAHSCGIDIAGQGYCWGNNSSGQLGDGSTVQRNDDTKSAGGVKFKQIRAGGSFTCAVGVDNLGYCWGNNSYGKLGLGDTNNRLTPTALPGFTF